MAHAPHPRRSCIPAWSAASHAVEVCLSTSNAVGGVGRLGRGWKAPLPPADVVPDPEFVADGLVDAHGLKAQRFMQTHTGGIGEGNPGKALVKPLEDQQLKERVIQGAAHAGAPRLGLDIHRDVHRPLIRGPRPVWTGIDIAQHLPLPVTDEPRQVPQRPSDALLHLHPRGRFDFKRNGRLPDHRRIDRQDGFGILRGGPRESSRSSPCSFGVLLAGIPPSGQHPDARQPTQHQESLL